MYLTAALKIRANDHDRRRLRAAMARWSAAQNQAMDRARARQGDLLRCIVPWKSKDGKRERLVVDGKRLHALTLECCRGIETHLHSSASMSLIVAVEEQLGSWLGLYLDWLAHNRTMPKPGFPVLPPGSPRIAEERYQVALTQLALCTELQEERAWTAAVSRAARARLLPQYFGAAASGGPGGMAHCGLLRRQDGRYFALLSLWPQGETMGEPVARARNRRDRGEVANVRSPEHAFDPTERARASVILPLEMGRGHERLFFGRAVPKSAELVRREDDYYLHIAFQFADREPREPSGAVMAVTRGIGTLMAVVVLDAEGNLLGRERVEGRDLARLIAAIQANRATRQQKGRTTAGDRRAGRAAEHHLYSAGHQLIDVACRSNAQIVLLADPGARKPQRMLAYRHFHRAAEILGQLAAEAGLPPPVERKIYGSWTTCVACGWKPGETVRHTEIEAGQCPGCAAARDPEYHLAHLLALDALRLRLPQEGRPPLGMFVRQRRSS